MNKKKKGHPYVSRLIHAVFNLHPLLLPSRLQNPRRILGIPAPDHSTIHKRFLKMDFNPLALNSEEIVIAVDSTGIKATRESG